MRQDILILAVILMWIAVMVGTYQRIFEMPKWFSDPPASFDLIRKQSKKARLFWIPLSALFMIAICTALILNWPYKETRVHIIGAIVCFGLTGILSGLFFVQEVIAFTKIPTSTEQTPELMQRVKFWLRWTTIRDVLQFLAAIFVTIAYNHSDNL
jgi:hypothetical protein